MTVEDLDALRREEELQLDAFDNDVAWTLGCALVEAGRQASAPITVDITRNGQQLFHAALPGTAPDNDEWARRKAVQTSNAITEVAIGDDGRAHTVCSFAGWPAR